MSEEKVYSPNAESSKEKDDLLAEIISLENQVLRNAPFDNWIINSPDDGARQESKT